MIVAKRKSNDHQSTETQVNKLPSKVQTWSPDHVKKFLEAFLRLTEEKLTRKNDPYEMDPSPAESIIELVEELNKNTGFITLYLIVDYHLI
ncbi:13695_t:CDS:2 [Funneliformis caledonium]|uniref:13695_t:CDS:1 n=2 Tax=Funneliformis TaxID=1117308 RepID=A0A9N8ZAX6_9GLOM|nr:13695_t:CDS:2 [Funneliformis caledonium]CAG8497116.1 5599_t:CDS:2 [Funneliformis mosseae]